MSMGLYIFCSLLLTKRVGEIVLASLERDNCNPPQCNALQQGQQLVVVIQEETAVADHGLGPPWIIEAVEAVAYNMLVRVTEAATKLHLRVRSNSRRSPPRKRPLACHWH